MAGVFWTWLLISGLTGAFSTTLGISIFEGSRIDCLENTAAFMERQIEVHEQGPIRHCK